MKRLLLVGLVLFSAAGWAQNVTLLKDINTATNASSSFPSNIVKNGAGTIFFTASDLERGNELWKTNGTDAGTVVVKDINPGSTGSNPANFVVIGNEVYFSANDGINGVELWRSDGTAAGTYMLEDINVGPNSSSPLELEVSGSTIYFSADTELHGRELWKSGTGINTAQEIVDIEAGSGNSSPSQITNANGIIYFTAFRTAEGRELWRYTGSTPINPIEDIYSGSTSSSISGITAVNPASSSVIVFSANTTANGIELWRSSGTSSGTYVIDIANFVIHIGPPLNIDIEDYDASSSPSDFIARNGIVYFGAANNDGDRGLYSTSGASSTDFDRLDALGNFDPEDMVVCSTGVVFFSGLDSGGDRELYRLSGTSVSLVENISSTGSSTPQHLIVPESGSFVYFTATSTSFGRELYTSTTSDATRISDISSGADDSSPNSLLYHAGVYMSGIHGTSGQELYFYNGSSTVLVKDINGGTEDASPVTFLNTGAKLFFQATDAGGQELWTSDGTTANTLRMADLAAGVSGSFAFPMAMAGSTLLFSANDGTNGTEMYTSTGAVGNFTLHNTNAAAGNFSPSSTSATLAGFVYFAGEASTTTGRELYRSNGGAPALVSNINSTADLDSNPSNFLTTEGTSMSATNLAFFTATTSTDGTELYRVTNTGVVSQVADININPATSSSPSSLTILGTNLYFACNDGSIGSEIYRTTGSVGNKTAVTNINPSTGDAFPAFLTAVNSKLVFRATDGTTGYEPWVLDPVTLISTRLKDINTSGDSSPSNFTLVGSTVYFTANNPSASGVELYKTDGTVAGTVLVKDIFPGVTSSSPTNLKNVNGTLYFRATNADGIFLMKSNGTAAGTIVATSAGVTYQEPANINHLSTPASTVNNIYFTAKTNTKGTELLFVKAEPPVQPSGLNLTRTASSVSGTFTGSSTGAPTGYLVVRNAVSAPEGLPVDGPTAYVAGNILSGSGVVVQQSASTTFNDNSLTANTAYFYKVFAYYHDGVSYIYQPNSPLAGTATTFSAEPTIQTAVTGVSSITQTSMIVSWSTAVAGNGTERIVLAQATSAVTGTPTDGTTFTASSNFQSAGSSTIGGAKVVYKGSGTAVTVTSLTPGTVYHFRAYELNGTGTQTNYLTTQPAGAASSGTTLAINNNQPTNLSFPVINPTSLNLSWDAAAAGLADGYLVTFKLGSDPDVGGQPVNGQQYTAGNAIGGSGTFVGIVDAAETLSGSVSGLSPASVYFFRVYAYTGSDAAPAYVLTGPLAGVQATLDTEPANGPAALTLHTPTSTSMSGTITAGSGSPAASAYLVLEKSGGAVSPDAPVDGTSYVVGATIGGSRVVHIGVGLSFLSDALDPNTTYHYSTFALRGSGVVANYNLTPAISSRTTLVEDPIDQPADFVFENPTSTTVDVSFTPAPTEPGGGYIVVRREGAAVAPPNVPLDGSAYTVGNSLGASTVVVYVGTGTSFSDTGMNPNITYHYAAASFNGSGTATNYLHAGVPAGSVTTLTAQPTSQPTNLVFSNRTNTSVDISFTAAAGPPTGYIVQRISAPTLAEPPVDGETYTAGELHGVDVVAFFGSATTFTDNNLVEGTQYHYAVFAFNGTTGTYNYLSTSPLEGSVFTLAEAPTDQPANLVFSGPTINSLHLDFDDAANLPAGYVVLRKLGSVPSEVPVDGTTYTAGTPFVSSHVAFVGSATEFTDAGLTANSVYHYAIFSFNGAGTYTTYLTTSPLTGSRTTLTSEPTAQPTALTFANITSSSASMGFTPSAATQYLVLWKAGNVAPTEVPVDGVTYADGINLETANVFTVTPAGLPVNQTTLSAASEYSYAIFAYSGTSGSNNYLTTSPLTGTVKTLAVAPGAPATALTFTSVATENVTVSWTAPAVAPAGYLVLRRQGSAPTGLPVNGTTYTAGSDLGDGKVAYVGVQVNFVDTDLIGETEYYYQVFVFNGNGATISYLTASPASGHQLLFAWEPINQPTNLRFTNITASGFTVAFTPDPDDFASGHIVVRKNGAAPTGPPVDGTTYIVSGPLGDGTVAYVGSASSFNETLALAPYNYAVYAYNGDIAAATNYLQGSPLTGILTTDNTPPVFTNNTTATIGSALPLKISSQVTDTESGISGTVTLEFKALTAAGTAFTSRDMAIVSGNYEAMLTGDEVGELGVVYRIKATNSQGMSATSTTFRTLVSFATLALPELPAGDGVEDYRIIAIPLQLASSNGAQVFAALGDPDKGKNWRMFHYSNGSTAEIETLSSLSVAPGKGYWLISKFSKVIQPGSGNAVDVTETTPFSISLTPGWNQIGNPYLFNILLSDINAANGTSLQLKTYHNQFTTATKLEKFEGGFVEVSAPIALKIPTAKNPAAGREGKIEPKLNPIGSEDWEVVINLNNGDSGNPFGGIGMSTQAKVGYDDLDDFTLPRFFKYVELNHNKQIYGMTYTKDIQPVTDNHTWEFVVESNVSRTTEMSWDNSYFGNSDLQLVLWDEAEQNAVDMRRSNSYGFSEGKSRKFRIFFGNQQYIDDKVEANSLKLHSIFPNPASSDVKVAFSLPGKESSHVKVRLVNSLGQQVVNIFEGVLEAGYHEVAWSGRQGSGERPAEGVYVVEVINGQLRESKRLVIK